jgi:putative membrane protein
MDKNTINKDLILREKLALARTKMAIETTFLAYLRTALYFTIAGISIPSFIKFDNPVFVAIIFWIFALAILGFGIRQTVLQYKKLKESEKHIGNYLLDYHNH